MTWIIVGLAALGIGAAIIHFLRTPKNLRYRLFSKRMPIEERVKRYPPSAGATIIRANRQRAMADGAVWLLLFLVASAPLLLLKFRNTATKAACYRILEFNIEYLSVLSFCYSLPAVALMGTAYMAWLGWKSLRSGYFPPLDCSFPQDRIAVRGWRATVGSVCCMLSLLLGIAVLYLGHTGFQAITHSAPMKEVVARIEKECP